MTTELDPALKILTGSKIEILISCTNLADLDEFTKTDPMCVMFIKQFGQWKEYGRTEAIRNTLNPKFVGSIVVSLDPSVSQQLKFSVYDIDSRSQDLKHHDFVGSTEVTLLKLINYPTKTICTTSKTLRIAGDSRPRGMINITTEILRDSRNKVNIHAGGHKLDKKGLFSMNKPDVYLELSRSIDNVVYHPVYRTEIVYKSTNPRWRPFEISVQKLCNCDWDRNIELSCWHFNGSDYHMIGRRITSLRDINNQPINCNHKDVYLSSPKKEKSGKKTKSTITGMLRLYQFRVDMHFSLLDYVRGGLELNLMIAIDFTASNGSIDEELSLHNIADIRQNQYLDAIETLGSLITQYNPDRPISVFGFGAKWKNKDLPYCFPLSGDKDNIAINSIKTIQELYETAVTNVKFGGPTYLSQVIEKSANLAERENMSQNKQIYTVLLIITDGVVNDLDRTIRRVISTSHLPLSIIIIGVGPADFLLMEQFHTVDKDVRLKNRKTKEEAIRQNTYFTAVRKDQTVNSSFISGARESFAALSMQVVEYMKMNNYHPNKPRLLRQEKEWYDPEEDKNQTESSVIFKTVSSVSLSTMVCDGPSCPTCGAPIEPGTNLFNEVANLT